MTPEARSEWDRRLGLKYKVKSGSREHMTPSLRIQRTAFAFSVALQLKKVNGRQFDDRDLEVPEGMKDVPQTD